MQFECQLLSFVAQGLDQGARPQYAAIAFDDNITAHIEGRVWDAGRAMFPEFANATGLDTVNQRLRSSMQPLLTVAQATPGGRHALSCPSPLLSCKEPQHAPVFRCSCISSTCIPASGLRSDQGLEILSVVTSQVEKGLHRRFTEVLALSWFCSNGC